MTAPFVVLGLPRSRTFWISRFLSYRGRECEHDPSRHFTSRLDICERFRRFGYGAADTCLGMIWHEIAGLMPPDLRVAIIHRPCADVKASAAAIGAPMPTDAWLNEFAARLDRIEGLHLEYASLSRRHGALTLFEHCLREPFEASWWESLRDLNLQCNSASYLSDVKRNLSGIRIVFGT